MLNTDQLGRVSDFVAVPGCGLKCYVSQIEMLVNGDVTDVQIMNARNDIENMAANFSVTYDLPNESSPIAGRTL